MFRLSRLKPRGLVVLKNQKAGEEKEIQYKKSKRVPADKDEGAADESPFDAKSNSMHMKR